MKIIYLILFAFTINACTTQKMDETQYMEDGFTKLNVITTKNRTPCNLLYKTERGELLDAVNGEEFLKNKSATAYWVKFTRLRQMNRCENAQPVEITEAVEIKQ